MSVTSSTQYNRYDDQRAAEQRAAHEPSMEEILASIRRIIADDEVLPLTRQAGPAPAPPAQASIPRAPVAPSSQRLPPAPSFTPPVQSHNSLKPPSAESSGLEGVAADRFASIVRKPQPSLLEKRVQPRDYAAPPADYPYTAPQPPSSAPYEPAPAPLMSAQTNASVASSFQALASSLGGDQQQMERTVTDLLKPMLKQWLDDNLPILVERLVRAEIERVARGGRDV
jgi:uncharacterized protein